MRPDFLSIWLSTLAMGFPLWAQSAEWSAQPEISLKTGYNDNIRLTTAPHDSVWETSLRPSVKFGVAKENQGLSGDASFSIRRFTGGSGRESSNVLDREDYHLDSVAYHNTERDSFSARLNFTRDSTLDTELDETGEVVPNRATRTSLALGPSWTRALDERTLFSLNSSLTTVSFTDEPENTRLVEYDAYAFSSSLSRQFTSRIRGTVSASYSSFRPETNIDSDTINLQAGISRNFSETLSTSWLAGWRETTTDSFAAEGYCIGADPDASFPDCTGSIFPPVVTEYSSEENKNTGSVFSVNIKKLLETGQLMASLSRTTRPNSDGELLDTTRLVLAGEHRFTEKLSSNLRIEYNEREVIVNRLGRESDQSSKNLFRVQPRVSWKWQREWVISGQYEYAKNENELSQTATRNAFYLTLNYRPTKISISR